MTSDTHPALRRLIDDPEGTHLYIVTTYYRQHQMFHYLSSQVSPSRSPDIRFFANGNRIIHKKGGQLILGVYSQGVDRLRGLQLSSIDKDGDVSLYGDELSDFWHDTKARIKRVKAT